MIYFEPTTIIQYGFKNTWPNVLPVGRGPGPIIIKQHPYEPYRNQKLRNYLIHCSFDGQWIFLQISGVFENIVIVFKILVVFEILIVFKLV